MILVSVPLHSCLQVLSATDHFNTDFTSTVCARKYHAIRENSRGKWLTVKLPSATFLACLSIGLSNSHLATSFSPMMASLCLDKHDILSQLMGKRTFPFCVVTKLSFCIVLLRFIFVQIPLFLTVQCNEGNCWRSQRIGKSIKKTLLKD